MLSLQRDLFFNLLVWPVRLLQASLLPVPVRCQCRSLPDWSARLLPVKASLLPVPVRCQCRSLPDWSARLLPVKASLLPVPVRCHYASVAVYWTGQPDYFQSDSYPQEGPGESCTFCRQSAKKIRHKTHCKTSKIYESPTCHQCPYCCSISTCRGQTEPVLKNLWSPRGQLQGHKNSQGRLHPSPL